MSGRAGSQAESALLVQLLVSGYTGWVQQYRLPESKRRFRWDLALPPARLVVDIAGGLWVGGHHSRAQGYEDDCEKACEAVCAGYRALNFTTDQVRSGRALYWIERVLRAAEPEPPEQREEATP